MYSKVLHLVLFCIHLGGIKVEFDAIRLNKIHLSVLKLYFPSIAYI